MTALSPTQHRLGIAAMLLCTLLWSTAGVVTRWSEVSNGWEATFWRSLFCAVFVGAAMLLRGGAGALRKLGVMGWAGAGSVLCWAAMFTFFMLALSRTTVANVLVMMATQPFLAAIAGWLLLGERVPARTWLAMLAAGAGIAVMFADALDTGSAAGSLLALVVPVASVANILLLKRSGTRVDLVPALVLGGLLSVILTAPAALPFTAGPRDLALFALLGAFQLALPCALFAAYAVKRLSAAEIGLLSLLEILLGPIWAWLGSGERPGDLALAGGALVLAALALNEAVGLHAQRRRAGG